MGITQAIRRTYTDDAEARSAPVTVMGAEFGQSLATEVSRKLPFQPSVIEEGLILPSFTKEGCAVAVSSISIIVGRASWDREKITVETFDGSMKEVLKPKVVEQDVVVVTVSRKDGITVRHIRKTVEDKVGKVTEQRRLEGDEEEKLMINLRKLNSRVIQFTPIDLSSSLSQTN